MDPLLTLPHLPVLLCLGGTLFLILFGASVSSRVKKLVVLGIFAVVGVILFLIRSQLPIDVVFSDWVTSLTLLGSLIYRIDAFSWTFAILLTVLLAALAWNLTTGNHHGEDWQLMSALLFISSAAFSILFSGNLLTLMFSWALLTAAVFVFMAFGGASGRATTYLLVFWSLGIALLVWATWSIGRGDGGRWMTVSYSPTATRAIFILAWISLAALPVHLWFASAEKQSTSLNGAEDSTDILLSLLYVIPSLLGLYLLMRLTVAQASLPERELWIGLGAVSLLLSSELAWSQQGRLKTLSYLAIAQSSGVMLSSALSFPQATGLILHWALFLPFAMLVLFLTPAYVANRGSAWHDWLSMIATGFAGACLIGLPPTAGFTVRAHLNKAILSYTADSFVTILLSALLFIAATLIAAAFFRLWLTPTDDAPSRSRWDQGVTGLLLIVPALAAGLLSAQFLANLTRGDWVGWSLWTYSSIEPEIWIAILLSACLGYVLSGWSPAITARTHPLWQFFAKLWNMAWLYRGIERLVRRGMDAVQILVNMVCGEHWLLWVFLVVLLFFWLYLLP